MTGIAVLGPVTLGDEGSTLSPRDRVVLCVLVARRGHEVTAETIAEGLWGEHPPASWHKVVQGCVVRLRRRLGSGAIVTEGRGYRLAVPAEEVDAARFERLVRRARELLVLDHHDQAAYTAAEALALWRGAPLADLEDWEPARGEADRLLELRRQAEELRVAALLLAGRHAEALPATRVLVEEEPLREHRWSLLARAQYQDGRQGEALATLRRARQTLADELGLDPGEELLALEEAVLRQDPALSRQAPGVTAASCPWPGLAAYDVDDTDTFFGRESELEECWGRLQRTGVLAVVGPSGSGKSSLVRAGLAARLVREGGDVRIFTPGPRPMDALGTATVEAACDAVLVVDQAEEALAPTVPAPVRAAFWQAVVDWAAHGPLVLTLRSDRLGELAAHTAAARLVEEGLYLLGAIREAGVRAAVEGPARQTGLILEQGLLDLLLRDVEGEPGSLPLLAHALRQTWERREGSSLTVAGYRASGGIRGAVAQSAERVYEESSPEQREALRELLLRMVHPGDGDGGEPVRTGVTRASVEDDPLQVLLVERLVRARLVTAGSDRLEIAHEALARAWPRLRSWLVEDVEGERIRHHLAAAAQGWQAMGRPTSELYRGTRLAAAREWRDSGGHRLTGPEEAFLLASEEEHASRFAQAEAEARRHRHLNRRLRLLAAGMALLALVAAVFGGIAMDQTRRAEQETQRAREQELTAAANADQARSHELSAASVAMVGEDPALARALAVMGAEGFPNVRSMDALHRAVAADRVEGRVSMNHTTGRLWAVLHPDGSRVALTAETVYDPAVALEVHDAVSGEVVWEWVRPEEPGYGSVVVAGAQYSPDGALLAGGVLVDESGDLRHGDTGSTPRPPRGVVGVHLWDGRTHEPVQVLDVGPCGGWPLAVAGDAVLVRTLAARPSDGLDPQEEERFVSRCRWDEGAMATLLVDRATGARRQVAITEHLNLHLTVGHAVRDDGSMAVVPDFDSWSAVLLDTATGREVDRLDGALAFDFDAAGTRLLVVDVGLDGTDEWRVVTVPGLRTEVVHTGRSSWSTYGRFAADGQTVWTTGTGNALVQWDAGNGRHLRELPAVGGGAPSDAGTRMLVPRPETTGAVLLDTGPPGELWAVPSCGGTAPNDQLEVVDGLVVVGRDCGAAGEGRLQTFTPGGEPVAAWTGVNWEGTAVDPRGRAFVARSGPRQADRSDPSTPWVGPLQVRDLHTGEPVVTLEGFCDHELYTPLSTVQGELADGCRRFPDQPFSFSAGAVAWSPDGRWIAAASEGVAVWDATTGALVKTLAHPGSTLWDRWSWPWDLEFSPDSRHLLLTTANRQVAAVSTATWEVDAEGALELQSGFSAGIVGHRPDGQVVMVTPLHQIAANASVLLLDPSTLAVTGLWSGVAEGAVASAHLSPDGRHLALATHEGVLTVMDLTTGSRLDRADPGIGPLAAVRWLDGDHLVVLGTSGALSTVTTDPQELLRHVRDGVWHGLTRTECATYDLVPCPTRAALQGLDSAVPAELRGTWSITWSEEAAREAVTQWAVEAFGGLDREARRSLQAEAALIAGTYRLELRESDYTITKGDPPEVWCTGEVTVDPDRSAHLLLGADDGQRCTDFHYAEVGWELQDGLLVLPPDTFRGPELDRVLWTSRPLQRLDG